MPLVTRTRSEVLTRLRKHFENAGLNAFNESGTPEHAILNMIADEMSSIYSFVELSYNGLQISTAIGIDLDNLAAIFGITRNISQPAMDNSDSNFKFYIDPILGIDASTLAAQHGLSSIIIPEGTIVSNAGTKQYRTTASVSMSGSDTQVFAPIVAMSVGSQYNVEAGILTAHNLGSMPTLRNIATSIRCTNLLPITSGESTETDADLRVRVTSAYSIGATSNLLAILEAARGVAGVADASIVPYVYGSGTLAVFVESTAPVVAVGTVRAVQEAVDNVVAVGNRAFVRYPDYKALKIRAEVTLVAGTDGDSYIQSTRTQITNFINNLPRGTAFNPDHLLSILEGPNVINATILRVQYGDFDIYTRKILNLQTFLPVTQELGQTEKWYTNSTMIDICFPGANE